MCIVIKQGQNIIKSAVFMSQPYLNLHAEQWNLTFHVKVRV